MASRRGVMITAGIVGALTVASFAVWFIPQNNSAVFVVTDFEVNLDGVRNVHATIIANMEAEFQSMLGGQITPDEYIMAAESSSNQINSQIIGLVSSDPPAEWQASYTVYLESLRQSNSYIRETIVYANLLRDGAESPRLDESLDAAGQFLADSEAAAEASEGLRP